MFIFQKIFSFLSGLLRRLIGGWLGDKNIISERGVQWLIGVILYGSAIYIKDLWFGGFDTWLYNWLPIWLFIPLGSLSIVYSLTSGHFPGFHCGTESDEYIKQQIENGRDIPFEKIVDKIMEKRGFEKFKEEWCFWQLLMCKVFSCIPAALFFGSLFLQVGVITAFAYPAMYWVKLKPFKNILTKPTNWGEFFQGYFTMCLLFL